MDYVRIRRIVESDFDSVVELSGGRRVLEEGSADYILREAVLELKLVEEEGLEKTTRREKVANIFREGQPDAPIVKVIPEMLDPAGARAYYNAVAGPIKTHVKKAADQLDKTRKRENAELVRVLVIVNNGYAALSHEEFKSICVKCAQNDTRKIDWVVCGGIYYYSDQFDSYVIAPFEGIPINIGSAFPSFELLQRDWGNFVENLVTDLIRGPGPPDTGRMPVLDLVFEIDGVRYVKPAPGMPESSFWPNGRRPRDNTTGITSCPPLALVFPGFSEEDWRLFRERLPDSKVLKTTYQGFQKFTREQERKCNKKLKPFVAIGVTYSDFIEWIARTNGNWRFADISEFAAEQFSTEVRKIVEASKSKSEVMISPLEYILCVVEEIGQDQANDFASIYYISRILGFEREELLLEKTRMFFEYALSVAGAYALKEGVSDVFYTRIQV